MHFSDINIDPIMHCNHHNAVKRATCAVKSGLKHLGSTISHKACCSGWSKPRFTPDPIKPNQQSLDCSFLNNAFKHNTAKSSFCWVGNLKWATQTAFKTVLQWISKERGEKKSWFYLCFAFKVPVEKFNLKSAYETLFTLTWMAMECKWDMITVLKEYSAQIHQIQSHTKACLVSEAGSFRLLQE